MRWWRRWPGSALGGDAGAANAAGGGAAEISLWRLDCGEFVINDYGAFFSDTFQYPPGPKPIVDSCYLIRHGERYMLWDTGLTDALVGRGFSNAAQSISLRRSLVDQLAQIRVRPEQIEIIGISHWHFDHIGQAADFPQARLLIGARRPRAAAPRRRRSTRTARAARALARAASARSRRSTATTTCSATAGW